MHILLTVLGLKDASAGWYLFWSGIFPDFVIFGGILTWYYHHTCHVDGCFRPGFHKVSYKNVTLGVCRRHHPDLPPRKVSKSELHREFNKVVHKG